MAKSNYQQQWRSNTPNKKIEAYLHVDVIAILDERTKAKGFRGRGETIADLVRQSVHAKPKPARKPEPDSVLQRKVVTPKRNDPDEYEPTDAELGKLEEDITLLVAPSHFVGLSEFARRSFTADYVPLKKMVDSLPKTMSKKALTAFIRLLKYQRDFFGYELNRKLPKKIKERAAALGVKEKKLEEDRKKQAVMLHGMHLRLTDAECRFLKGILHPDRLPPDTDEETQKKWAKGFRLINKAL